MNLYNFALTATELNPDERREMRLPEHLQTASPLAKLGKDFAVTQVTTHWT
jgi:hypothetical protein